jgi:hypothetical protein
MALLLACSISQARLGENSQQVEARYGKPLDGSIVPAGQEYSKYGDQLGRYSKNVYKIIIVFDEGKSVYESFQKTNPYGLATLANNDVEYFLGANVADSTWTRQKDGLRWQRADGAAVAVINPDHTSLIIHLVEAARKGI